MKQKMQKAVTLLIVLSMVLSLFTAQSITGFAQSLKFEKDGSVKTGVFEEYEVEDGCVKIEAEDVVIGDGYTTSKQKTASGGKVAIPTKTNMSQPAIDADADIAFEIKTEKAGKYKIYARLIAQSGGQDSTWLSISSLNGGKYITRMAKGDTYSEDNNDFKWASIGSFDVKEDGEIVTLAFITRETTRFDCFIITNRKLFIPEGKGELPKGEETFEPIEFPDDVYPMPTITPPPEHPRVLFRESDLEQIRENMKSGELADVVKSFEKYRDKKFTGELPDKGEATNFDADGLATIEAYAFDYALNGNEEKGRAAIDAMINYLMTVQLSTSTENTRVIGQMLFTTAEVYDWCYDLCTDEEKATLLALCQGYAGSMEVGLPPVKMVNHEGHAGEQQVQRDWLALAIAVYDEYPDIYNLVGGRILSTFPGSRDYWNKSGTHMQSISYAGPTRYASELWGQWLIYRMSGDMLYNEDFEKLGYWWIYMRRPDGQLMRDGDTFCHYYEKGEYWNDMPNTWFQVANLYKNPIFNQMFAIQGELDKYATDAWSRTPVQTLAFYDPSVGTQSFEVLPEAKIFPSPANRVIARTGWNIGMESPDVHVDMKIGGNYSFDHAHRDAGSFQLYYKGPLAIDAGWYELYGTDHDANYNKATYAHNTLIIETKDNPDGQQRAIAYDGPTTEGKAQLLGAEVGPDLQYPQYSYISGDIAPAYSEDVEEAVRSMIFMPREDENHPAAFVVFDRIETDKAGVNKKFLLHTINRPDINGNVSTITSDTDGYNGKLVNQTLLPADAQIERIGGEGKRYWINGTDHLPMKDSKAGPYETSNGVSYSAPQLDEKRAATELGWGRIEISTQSENKVDYFLNVMYVSNADEQDKTVQTAELIETDTFVGAKILDRVAMFNREKDRTSDDVKFTVNGNETALKVNVAGLDAGTWAIKVNGNDIGTQVASEDGGIIYFTAPAGEYEITYQSSASEKTFEQSAPPEVEGVSIKLNDNFLYSDVPPTIINDRTLIPMRALLEALGADVTWDEATATATAENKTTKLVITENQRTVYVNDAPVELDVPAMIINGRFMIPVRFVSESLGADVEWKEKGQIVKISAEVVTKQSAQAYAQNWDFPYAIPIVRATQSGDDGTGNTIQNSFDASVSTRWAVQGTEDSDAWGIYDLGSVYSLDKIRIAFMQGDVRTYTFDIAVSEDGDNYTTVLEGQESSGTTSELEAYDLNGVKAQYVKFIGYGNTVNKWNSILETVFTEKKFDIENMIRVVDVEQSGDDGTGNTIENSIDGLTSNRWAVQGKDGEAWGIYDLGKSYSLDNIWIAFMQGDVRVYTFDIAVSNDRENWKTVLASQKSSGTTPNLEAHGLGGVKARYVKFIGRGNSVNLWNSLSEVVFSGVK